MKTEEIVNIELEGITKTIHEYTTDNYIRSYSKQLERISYPAEKDKLRMIVKRLCEWYKENIDVILSGEYILNKESHKKSYNLLLILSESLMTDKGR